MKDNERFLSRLRTRVCGGKDSLVIASDVDLSPGTDLEESAVAASQVKTRGPGIRIRKLLSFGSKIEIDTGE
ncbi:hypothetical protein ACFL0Y_04685 [Patescibacteria group bacterium]